jgi:transposase
LLYSYAVGERSSRRIERRCVEDVATRVVCANRAPDHTTIARFRQRHEAALAELEFPRFRGHLIAGPSGPAARIDVHAVNPAVFA